MKPLKTFQNLPPAKQENIIRTALSEFGEKGYQGASINAMVKELGIAKGSIYQYFEDKRALFLFIFDRFMDRVKQHLKTVRDQSQEQPLGERLRLLLTEGVRFIAHHPDIYKLYVTLHIDRSLPMREELLQAIRAYSLDYIGSFLEQARSCGEIKPDIDIRKTGFVIDAIMDRFLLARTIPHMAHGTDIFLGSPDVIAQWIDSIVSLLCLGVIDG